MADLSAPSAEKRAPLTEEVEELGDATKPAGAVLDAAAKGQATSGYENLSHWETVKTFKVATIICFPPLPLVRQPMDIRLGTFLAPK